MDDNKHPPKNWGDWRQCELCHVVQPQRSLDSSMHCLNKEWCANVRGASGVSTSVGENKTP